MHVQWERLASVQLLLHFHTISVFKFLHCRDLNLNAKPTPLAASHDTLPPRLLYSKESKPTLIRVWVRRYAQLFCTLIQRKRKNKHTTKLPSEHTHSQKKREFNKRKKKKKRKRKWVPAYPLILAPPPARTPSPALCSSPLPRAAHLLRRAVPRLPASAAPMVGGTMMRRC